VLAVADPIEPVYQQEYMNYGLMKGLAPFVDEEWSLYRKDFAFEALN